MHLGFLPFKQLFYPNLCILCFLRTCAYVCIFVSPIDKPPLTVQGLRWHLNHLYITDWARPFASLKLISATLKLQKYRKTSTESLRNTDVQQEHQIAQDMVSPWRLHPGDYLFWLLFQLNSGWSILQRTYGSWFSRYPDWALGWSTVQLTFSPYICAFPNGAWSRCADLCSNLKAHLGAAG